MRDSFNWNDREIAIATRAQPEFEPISQLKARLHRDSYDYERLHTSRLVEAGIIEERKGPYGQILVRRGLAWEEFFSVYGLRDTEKGLHHIESMERLDEFLREFQPIIDAAPNPNVVPFPPSL